MARKTSSKPPLAAHFSRRARWWLDSFEITSQMQRAHGRVEFIPSLEMVIVVSS